MSQLSVRPVDEAGRLANSACISRITYEPNQLEVSLEHDEDVITVRFEGVVGFRVLDERDLLEFWPTCSTPNGWFFEILSGGWRAHEEARSAFLAPTMFKSLKEYLVTGVNDCVSVLTDGTDRPVIVQVRSNPSLERP